MTSIDWKKTLRITIPVLIAIFSIFVLSKYATSPEFHSRTIAALDEKKTTVMELTAASTAASVAVTALPGDVATPLADKLIDLSSAFWVVLSALYLEKYLVTITGYATFYILIPIACVLFSLHAIKENEMIHFLAKKMVIFGLAIVMVVPVSVKVSDLIEKTYQASIDSTIEAAKGAAEEMEDKEEGTGLSGLLSKVEESVTSAVVKIENVLNNFLEALAVMIVTSCVIPILVLMFFIWLIKIILGVNINIPMTKIGK